MQEIEISENVIYVFEGNRYVWRGDEIVDLTRNNKYHIRSAISIGGNGYSHGILSHNGSKARLIFRKSTPELPEPLQSDTANPAPKNPTVVPDLKSDSSSESDEMPPLIPLASINASEISVLSDIVIPAGKTVVIGDVTATGRILTPSKKK